MKYLLLFTTLCLVLFACKKNDLQKQSGGPYSRTGRWNYSQRYYSIGGPAIFESTASLHQWIEFSDDGKFKTNMPELSSWMGFEKIDSIRFRFTSTSQPPERYFSRFDSVKHTLTLSSIDHFCYEGCGFQFKR